MASRGHAWVCCRRRAPTVSAPMSAPSAAATSPSLVAGESAEGSSEAVAAEQSLTETAAAAAGTEAASLAPSPLASPSGATSWEEIKAEATKRYMADDFEGAVEGYGAAIKAFEKEHGDEPEGATLRKPLSILLTNRAMTALQIIKKAHKGKTISPGMTLKPELRKLAMRANVDASQAAELDESNAKAWLRKGQALLWMSALPQRAKEAMLALERARDSPSLPASVKPEVDKWHAYAKGMFDDQTNMPASCPQM